MSVSRPRALALNRELKQARDYWVGQLSREIECSGLRTDFERPPGVSLSRSSLRIEFPHDLCAEISKLTNASPLLTFTTLLAALNICLHRYTESRIIVVGCPPRLKDDTSSLEPNALAILVEIDGRETFRQLLLKVRETLVEAISWQSYPCDRLVKDLGLELSDHGCPLFDITLALKNIHGKLPDVNQDIAMTFELTAEGSISGVVDYKDDLFRPESIERFTQHWMNVLGAALKDLNAPIDRIELTSETERRQILNEWNKTAAAYAADKCFHQLFEAQAAQTVTAIAVSFQDTQVTYAELNRRANQFAHYLRAHGVGPEVLVGISLPRSAELIVALLGVFKAGGAYLPLDLSYPKERIAYMMNDARVPVLLTLQKLLPELPDTDAQIICLDGDAESIAAQSIENPVNLSTPENAAYVIYTSGSTGRPKGVVVRHGGLCNLTEAQRRTFAVERDDRVLQFSSLNFDASIFEIVMALRSSATLHLSAAESLMPGSDLLRFLRTHAIGNVTLPPSALMVTAVEDLPALKTIIVAGEACPAELVARWAKGRRFFNAYGPTETTVWATVKQCFGGEDKPPIGRPITNHRAYVLNKQLQPLPIGVSGELYIGGDGLARGYLKGPELTAERFIPDEFSSVAGARLYRTGDLARYRADGELDFLGRIDNQVKIRGYRIELGEIEAALCAVAGVREAVVVARPDAQGEQRLVAYVVGEAAGLDQSTLRRELGVRLPDYMVPAVIVELDQLPLTANGKVDRRALPEPERMRSQESEYAAARTPVEELLCGIWAEVLGVERVGVEDNFFELGGHSLLATQVVSRVRETCGVEIALRELFEAPSVRLLAVVVEEARRVDQGVAAPPIVAVERDRELPLSFAQQRLWFLDQLEPHNPFYNIPAVVHLQGALDLRALTEAFTALVRRHESLRTSFAAPEGRPQQVIAAPADFTLTIEDLSDRNVEQRLALATELAQQPRDLEAGGLLVRATELAAAEAQRPFDLEAGGLLRVKLWRLSAEEHVLALVMHHIVSDGWSMGVLVRELVELYASSRTGREAGLEPLAVQYADFAVWQREWLSGDVLERQLVYWSKQLAGAPSLLELPTDFPRPAVKSHRGATVPFNVTAELTADLKQLSQRSGVTLFMTLLAAFDVLLMHYTNQTDIVVGTNIANRNRAETENLIGFFVNNLVLRTDLSGNPAFRELLDRVRNVCLGAYIHQDMPFDKLVEELRPERMLSHNPLFQVMFVLQNAPRTVLEVPGLTFRSISNTRNVSRFDLLVNVFETPDGLQGSAEYSTDLFDASTVKRMLDHYATLLAAVAADPDKPLQSFSLMQETDSQQLIHAFNEVLE